MNLSAIQSKQEMFGLFELDIAPHLAESLGLDLSLPENEQLVREQLQLLGQLASQHTTGVVIDPIYSFDLVNHQGKAGLITRLTTLNAAVDPLVVPTLIPDYGLEEMRQNYSLAKLELYYHPQEEQALHKKQLLAEIHDYCDYLDINLLLKLIIYTPADQDFEQKVFQEDQLQAVQELRSMTDILALQYPLDPLATATVTAELDIPWLLIGQDQAYEDYKSTLRLCLENGARGFLAGNSLWQEIQDFKQQDKSPDLEQIQQFVNTTVKDRMIELMRITNEKTTV
jgi:tagatose-1,6-bisphosphate aldolase